jgi:4-amino-4-deoxy-L-arabinose transferase-like glycosyltransferase
MRRKTAVRFRSDSIKNLWLILALVGLALVVFVFEFTLNAQFLGSDDAYIHLRYIDNLRNGDGFGFNPNMPAYGDTSPLWVFIAAGITQMASDLPQAVKTLAVLLFVSSIFIFYMLTFQLTSSRKLAFLGTAIYVSDGWLLKWAGSAMEASLASFLVLSIALFFVKSEKIRNLVVTSILLSIATLARPEFLLLFLCFFVLQLTLGASLAEKTKRVLFVSIIYFGILVPWSLYALNTFQTAVPYTFLAKTVASTTTMWQVGWYFFRIIGVTYWWVWLTLFATILLCFVIRVHNCVGSLKKSENRAIILFWLWCISLPIYYTVGKLQTPSTRYLQITTPLLILVGFYGIVTLVSVYLVRQQRRKYLQPIITLVTVSIVIFNIALNMFLVLPSNLDFSSGLLDTYRDVGNWLRNNTKESSRIAVAIDVGTIGYFSKREIIDLGGLNTLEVIPYLPNSIQYVFVSKPDYLVVTGESEQYRLVNEPIFEEVASPVFSLPMEIGMRANIDQATGGSQKFDQFVTVYQLLWR